MKQILVVNNVDLTNLVQTYKVGYETLVAENSGRNANGDTVLDVVNRKIKVYVGFKPMHSTDMKRLLGSLKGYVIPVKFFDSETDTIKTITAYHGTPNPDFFWITDKDIMYKAFNLNFIEM